VYYDITVPQLKKMLRNLSGFLDKAAAYADAKKFDHEVLLQARLAPDQFPLVRQVQIATDTAKLGVARLAGKEAPVHEDKEKTIGELKGRIESVLAYLDTFTAKDFEGAADRRVTQPRWAGKWLTGKEYLIQHMLPNFHFHVTVAYEIIRHNGVDLGKKDYLGAIDLRD